MVVPGRPPRGGLRRVNSTGVSIMYVLVSRLPKLTEQPSWWSNCHLLAASPRQRRAQQPAHREQKLTHLARRQ